eukprot:5622171-Prymnesium_polylepis.1
MPSHVKSLPLSLLRPRLSRSVPCCARAQTTRHHREGPKRPRGAASRPTRMGDCVGVRRARHHGDRALALGEGGREGAPRARAPPASPPAPSLPGCR